MEQSRMFNLIDAQQKYWFFW